MEHIKDTNIAVYDFDKTIYNGETMFNFWGFVVRKKVQLLLLIPYQMLFIILYMFKLIDLKLLKEKVMVFINFLDRKTLERYIEEFWQQNIYKLGEWFFVRKYIDKHNGDCLICISASPDFLLRSLIKEVGFDLCIATEFTMNNNKIIGNNCKGIEKVEKLRNWARENGRNIIVKKMYSDSMADLPLYDLAEHKYTIKGYIIKVGLPNK